MAENVSGYYVSQKFISALQVAQGFQDTVAWLNIYAVSGPDFHQEWLSLFNRMDNIVTQVQSANPAFKGCLLTISTSSGKVAYMQGKTFDEILLAPNANTSSSVSAALQYYNGNVDIVRNSGYSKQTKEALFDLIAAGYEIEATPLAIKNADGRFDGFATSQSLSKAYRPFEHIFLQLRAQIGNWRTSSYVATSTRIQNLSSNYL